MRTKWSDRNECVVERSELIVELGEEIEAAHWSACPSTQSVWEPTNEQFC
ncbi:MAG: hypothetical protein WCJ95_21675 [Mariniphaga sp.]